MRRLPFLICAVALAFAPRSAARAQYVQVIYLPGWNMVGAPSGATIDGAARLLTYDGDAYRDQPGRDLTSCTGAWAYIVLPVDGPSPSTSGSRHESVACDLHVGWNLLGNPTYSPATLPTGVTGYGWNPQDVRYDTVRTIPVDGAVWIDAPTATTLVLSSP
jgi:hypothetical protein